jgi:hypothetical protein
MKIEDVKVGETYWAGRLSGHRLLKAESIHGIDKNAVCGTETSPHGQWEASWLAEQLTPIDPAEWFLWPDNEVQRWADMSAEDVALLGEMSFDNDQGAWNAASRRTGAREKYAETEGWLHTHPEFETSDFEALLCEARDHFRAKAKGREVTYRLHFARTVARVALARRNRNAVTDAEPPPSLNWLGNDCHCGSPHCRLCSTVRLTIQPEPEWKNGLHTLHPGHGQLSARRQSRDLTKRTDAPNYGGWSESDVMAYLSRYGNAGNNRGEFFCRRGCFWLVWLSWDAELEAWDTVIGTDSMAPPAAREWHRSPSDAMQWAVSRWRELVAESDPEPVLPWRPAKNIAFDVDTRHIGTGDLGQRTEHGTGYHDAGNLPPEQQGRRFKTRNDGEG